jgi:hypothetical protein
LQAGAKTSSAALGFADRRNWHTLCPKAWCELLDRRVTLESCHRPLGAVEDYTRSCGDSGLRAKPPNHAAAHSESSTGPTAIGQGNLQTRLAAFPAALEGVEGSENFHIFLHIHRDKAKSSINIKKLRETLPDSKERLGLGGAPYPQSRRQARARVAELVDARDSKSRSERNGGSIPSTGTTKAFHRCSPCTISESNQSLNRCDSQKGRTSGPLFVHIRSARIST